ncbi:TetR/AcrR family transcriptional regulator [Geodermatophilus sp. URMC 61]|uniref:TetR/AcrR family transcriptional regulator n=1 Tax=Geodermatophilus sp. URMC 61 TaxID=3423411 RepID=UPI00406C9A5B
MPRTADPAVRRALVETAAELLARREPVTARALADRVGTSTTALYTHFGGMPGLWRAVRREGFTRLAERLSAVPRSSDPVRDLAALGAAYLGSARSDPFLYRAMFDAAADLEDPAVADSAFALLVDAAERARQAERFAGTAEPLEVATRYWAAGHGLAMLVVTGVLPAETLVLHAPELAVAVFVAAGDEPDRCRNSVASGWTDARARAGAPG